MNLRERIQGWAQPIYFLGQNRITLTGAVITTSTAQGRAGGDHRAREGDAVLPKKVNWLGPALDAFSQIHLKPPLPFLRFSLRRHAGTLPTPPRTIRRVR